MTKVAEQLGIHVATVSRAVADKYVQTPRGIVALRKFFSGGTVSTSGDNAGSEVSWDAVRAALQDIIDKEDRKNPLSDDDLSEELKKRGLEIARRTVAKYRGQLNIPTGRLRKVHG
jgi:RNA polymerase sigma-54 factor